MQFGVPHIDSAPVQSLPLVGSADAVCAQNTRPDGVVRRFQVCRNSIEPHRGSRSATRAANRSDNVGTCDLFAKHDRGSALSDEAVERGPEVAVVVRPFPCTGATEGLAGAASGPNRDSCRPSSKLEREGPSADAGEEVALVESVKVSGLYVGNASFINCPFWYQVVPHESAQPQGRVGRNVVVEVHRRFAPSTIPTATNNRKTIPNDSGCAICQSIHSVGRPE